MLLVVPGATIRTYNNSKEHSTIKTASVTVLKAKLSEFLARVKRGEEVAVTERGRQVARIVPITRIGAGGNTGIVELIRKGIIRRGRKGGVRLDFLRRPRPKDPHGSVLKALLDERAQGR